MWLQPTAQRSHAAGALEAPVAPPPDRPVWRNGAFVTFWTGQSISLLGDAVGGLALPLLVLALTGSALQMGTVVAILAAPLPLLSLPAGALVDRLDRRRTMIWSDTGRALLFTGLAAGAALGWLDLPALYVAAALLGTLQVFFYLSGQVAVPSLVPRGRIVQANSFVQASTAASALLGLPIAGLLIATIGAGRALDVDALTFVVSALSLLALRRPLVHPLPVPSEPPVPPEAQPLPPRLPYFGHIVTRLPSYEDLLALPARLPGYGLSLLARLRDLAGATLAGLGIVWRTPALRAATSLTVGLNLILSLGVATGLFRLRHDLHLSPTLIGFIFAGASAGAILLALAAGRLRRRLGVAGALLLAVAVQAPVALGIGWATSAMLLGICYALSSGAGSLFAITTVSLRETTVPQPLLGRVTAAAQTLWALVIPLGNFAGGVLTDRLGASLTYTIMAGALLLLLLAALLARLPRAVARTAVARA